MKSLYFKLNLNVKLAENIQIRLLCRIINQGTKTKRKKKHTFSWEMQIERLKKNHCIWYIPYGVWKI